MGSALLFSALLLLGFSAFAWTTLRFYRTLSLGRPDLKVDHLGQRLMGVWVYWLFQKKVGQPVSYQAPKGVTSKHHYFIFAGFLIITLGTMELFIQGIFPSFDIHRLSHPLAMGLHGLIDVFNGLVLLMIVYAFVRRIFLKPQLLPMSLDALLILSLIALLMITHFGVHACKQAAFPKTLPFGPLSSGLAYLLRNGNPRWLYGMAQACYWIHIVTLLVFLNYIPYSKHIHIIGSLPNIFFRKLGPKGVMPKLNLEDETDWGVGKITQFSQKSLLDQYACTDCARCSNFCPAFQTGKPLSPMQLVHDLREEMKERGPLEYKLQQDRDAHPSSASGVSSVLQRLQNMPPLVGGRIQEETLWACTTCGACQEVCPVLIDHPLKIQQMKTHLVLSEGRIPLALQRTFQNIERSNNPWGLPAEQRLEWAKDLPLPTLEEVPQAEYLLFVGCAGAFEDRAKRSMRALVEVLLAAKVSFAVLGKKERCSGDPARRAGNEFLFQQQAEGNVAVMNQAAVRKVITNCPHCFHTIKNEYPQFGGHYEVLHHSQLVHQLLQSGRLQTIDTLPEKVTYHDSCYLGRWNGEYEAPREILHQIGKSKKIIELERNKERSFCCGAGGGRMWQEEKEPRINHNRTKEILHSGAEVAVVACPFCTVMIADGLKDQEVAKSVQVLDIAEVVRDSLKEKALYSK